MKNKPFVHYLTVFLICCFLVGCATPTAAPTAQAPAAATQPQGKASIPLKIALVLSTSESDSGWDSTAYQGGQDAKAQLNAEVSVNENTTTSGAEAVIRDYASRGYNLIIANDFSMGPAVMKVAPSFPNSKFVVTTGIWTAANVSSFNPVPEDYYIGGCLDALMSKSGKIGVMGGVDQPAVVGTANAIADGAKQCKPDIQVSYAYVGSWSDPATAKQLATAFIASGIDVIDGTVSEGYQGVLDAITQAATSGKTVYTVTDQVYKPTFPKQIIAAHTQDHGPMVMYYAKEVQSGTFQGVNLNPGLSTGLIYLKMTDAVPSDIQAQVVALQQKIVSGQIKYVERFTK
jgi:basic membrane protein A and related proteins